MGKELGFITECDVGVFFFFVSLTMDKDKGKCANRTLDTSSDFGVLLKHMDFP